MHIWDLIFHVTTKLLQDHNETYDPPSQVEFVKNILVGNV
jgi:hypothetical protein